MEALQKVSVSELVATLRAKARRHGTQTSQYRGVSLLKQTGKWHGQINVGGKQLHLGFFATEELAARAYDRAAIHKASTEGGGIVTNLDISEYAHEIEKLQRMTRKELLSMIADEKKQQQNLANSVQKDDSDGSNGGSGSGSGTGRASRVEEVRQAVRAPEQPKQRVAAHARRIYAERQGREQLADEPGRVGATRRRTRRRGRRVGSSGQAPAGEARGAGGDKQKSPQPAAVAAGLARIEGKVGNKRAIEEAIMPPPSPRSKHRRTKMAPSRAPVSGGFAA